MQLIPIKTSILQPPQADLLAAIKESGWVLENGDMVVIASKVVAIDEGRCVPRESLKQKDELIKRESQWYLERNQVPGEVVMHAMVNDQLAVSAGIDPFGDYYILWPKNPIQSAERLVAGLKQSFRLEQLGVIVSDSKSTTLRRGVVGGAIGWAGFSPLFDNRSRHDLTGKETGGSQINVADALAAAAVLVMGEGIEQTPVVVVKGAPYAFSDYEPQKHKFNDYVVDRTEDIFAPFINQLPWQKGGANY